MDLYSLTTKLFSQRLWPFYLVCIITLLSQFLTAVMNIVNGLIWWGRIDVELILIGCIDSLVATSIIAPLAIYLIRHSFNLEEMNRKLQKEVIERVAAEKALRATEERFRLITDNLRDTVWLMDMNLQATWISPSVERKRGFTLEELRNLPLEGHLTPESLQKAQELIACTMTPEKLGAESGDVTIAEELEFYCKDGSTFWADTVITLLRDGYGKPAGLLGLSRDTTERREMEEALRKSEEDYRLLFESAGEGIMIAQGDTIRLANPTLVNILGYPPATITAQPFVTFIHPDDRAAVLDRHMRRMKGEAPETGYSFRIVTADGTEKWLEIHSQVISWRGAPASLSFVTDITDRKRVEEELRESEERFRALSENAPDIIYTMDLTGTITYANPAWKRALGHDHQEVVGRYFIDFAREDDKRTYRKLFKAIRDDGNIVTNHTGILLAKDGGERWFTMNSAFNRDPNGQITGVVGTLKDITEIREMEDRLSQAQKMESIGTLAGGIAHDFNNLLMGIQGYASLTMLDMDARHPHYKNLRRIVEQVQSGADLTRQLLGFARGGRYEVKASDLNELIERTSAMFARTKKEIGLHKRLSAGLWTVEVDRGQMEQVFLNLYVNAWQAMPQGGRLLLETDNAVVDEAQGKGLGCRSGRYVRVSVTDTGCGMDEKTRERIFDPFFTTKGMGRGTGLGLAMVYGIIQGHGGVIHVESEPGRGTTFTIHLPASDKEVAVKRAVKEKVVRGTETILLVDDEKPVLEVGTALLEALGYRVHAAGSGREALDLYRDRKDEIALVILDMIMTGMSGGDTFVHLREIDPDVRVLLSSGYSIDSQAREIMEKGCNGFLQKPFLIERLSVKIREVLGEEQSQGVARC